MNSTNTSWLFTTRSVRLKELLVQNYLKEFEVYQKRREFGILLGFVFALRVVEVHLARLAQRNLLGKATRVVQNDVYYTISPLKRTPRSKFGPKHVEGYQKRREFGILLGGERLERGFVFASRVMEVHFVRLAQRHLLLVLRLSRVGSQVSVALRTRHTLEPLSWN